MPSTTKTPIIRNSPIAAIAKTFFSAMPPLCRRSHAAARAHDAAPGMMVFFTFMPVGAIIGEIFEARKQAAAQK